MRWSDKAFRERVVARAAELGRSVRSILIEAHVALDIFEKGPTAGRRIDTLEKIADACGWSLAEIMGFQTFERISPELLEQAVKIVRRGLRLVPDAEEAFAPCLAQVYNVLAARRRDGLPIDDSAISTIEAIVAEHWGPGRNKKGQQPNR